MEKFEFVLAHNESIECNLEEPFIWNYGTVFIEADNINSACEEFLNQYNVEFEKMLGCEFEGEKGWVAYNNNWDGDSITFAVSVM